MKILPRPDRVSDELISQVLEVDPATIGHFVEFGFVDPAIRPLWNSPKVAGRAFTIRTASMDSTMMHRAVELMQPGDIVFVERARNYTHASVGGGVAYACKARGVRAIVMDGVATDLQEIVEYQVPTYARGLSNLTCKMQGFPGDINVPVSIGGVVVNPGDLVVCDCNGVMVLDPDEAPELIRISREAEARWPITRAKLDQGIPITAISGSKNVIEANIPQLLFAIKAGRKV